MTFKKFRNCETFEISRPMRRRRPAEAATLIESAFPSRQEVEDVLAVLPPARNGRSVNELMTRVNARFFFHCRLDMFRYSRSLDRKVLHG